MLRNYFNDAKPKKINKAKEVSNSNEYEIYLGTFDDNVFTWYSISKHKELGKAYKEYKKYVNSQLKYTDEELQKVWDTGRLDIELRQGNKLLNWVGIYSREVVKADKTGEEPEKKKQTKDSCAHDVLVHECTRCHEPVDRDDVEFLEGEPYCHACYEYAVRHEKERHCGPYYDSFECTGCHTLVDGKPALVINDEAFCEKCADDIKRFTPEEQKEYDIDEFGVSNTGYDEYIRCDWCDEPISKSEAVHESNIGNLCPSCVAALRSRGEKLTIADDEKTYDLTNPDDFDKVLAMLGDYIIPNELSYEDVPVSAGKSTHPVDYEPNELTVEVSFSYPYDIDNIYNDLPKYFGRDIISQADIDKFDESDFYNFLLDKYFDEAFYMNNYNEPWEDSVNDRYEGGKGLGIFINNNEVTSEIHEYLEAPIFIATSYKAYCLDSGMKITKSGKVLPRNFKDPHIQYVREKLGDGKLMDYTYDIKLEIAEILDISPEYIEIKPSKSNASKIPAKLYNYIAEVDIARTKQKIAKLENQLGDPKDPRIEEEIRRLNNRIKMVEANPESLQKIAIMAILPAKIVIKDLFKAFGRPSFKQWLIEMGYVEEEEEFQAAQK